MISFAQDPLHAGPVRPPFRHARSAGGGAAHLPYQTHPVPGKTDHLGPGRFKERLAFAEDLAADATPTPGARRGATHGLRALCTVIDYPHGR